MIRTLSIIAGGVLFTAAGTSVAEAQCGTGARHFASLKGEAASQINLRVDPGDSGTVRPDGETRGLEFGRFWQSEDSELGNNFVPGDPAKRMAPAGCDLNQPGTVCCASTDPARTPDGGWWQASQTTKAGVWGFISGPGCRANTCPTGDVTYVVEDWGAAGPPGILDTAFFVGWRADHTPGQLRDWNLAKACGEATCTVPFREFPVPLVAASGPPGSFTIRSNRDPGENVHVFTPAEGAASLAIDSFDVLVHVGESDPGRDRHASCGGGPCWSLIAQIPYQDAALPPTAIDIVCDHPAPVQAFVALGLSFEGGAGGPVPSHLVGRAVPIDCDCDDSDGDGAGCGDCDDTAAENFLGNEETCDGLDNDCDGLVDLGDPNVAATWYLDGDGDGFGHSTESLITCDPPPGYVAVPDDCDDTDSQVYPGATEVCDDQDNDCDTLVDDADPDIVGAQTWYRDQDEDGYGDPGQVLLSCDQPFGYVANSSDCNDADASDSPEGNEICDHHDNDCDGLFDDDDPGVVGQEKWHPDEDGDGFGTFAPLQTVVACFGPPNYVGNNVDCDDTDPNNYPANTEVCDGQDNDCDSYIDVLDPDVIADVWYRDVDGDGYGDPTFPLPACVQPDGYVDNNSDCDDTDATNFPGNPEVCDGNDNNCDQLIDFGIPGCSFPTAVPTSTLLSDCATPSGATILFDGSASFDPADDIVLYEWFEDYGKPQQTLLGQGITLEVTLPVTLHVVTLRVTDADLNANTQAFAVTYKMECWQAVDPVQIVIDRLVKATLVYWNDSPGVDSYDVLRGRLGDIRQTSTFSALGPVVCVEDDSLDTTTEGWLDPAVPLPGQAFFYVVRQHGATQGIYGVGSDARPRVPTTGDCPQ